MATNPEVVEAFITKAEDDKRAENLFTQNGVIYSYGMHWPLAVWCASNEAEAQDLVLINSTRRSHTSTIHVGLVSKALTQAGVQFKMGTMQEVKDIING